MRVMIFLFFYFLMKLLVEETPFKLYAWYDMGVCTYITIVQWLIFPYAYTYTGLEMSYES